MTTQPERLPTDVVEARLNHLIDRARRGRLLHEEADRFTTELRDLVRRMEDTEDERDRLAADVARLTAGQCLDQRAMCEQHHQPPVAGCPYPRCRAARATERAATA
ncbi:hypothetical protein AB0L02_27480 [Streptomyces anulatus]|uniref:hypothetical protein n=1 Tax=Streptomyces anulatus TaxID=1892 RepID=UPI00343B1383